MTRPLILAVAGVLVGVGVAFGVFFFVLGGGNKPAEAVAEPQVVDFGGRLGPHITLEDRVFNLQGSGTPVYLKVQTIIEFETTEAAWAKFAETCVSARPIGPRSQAMVSAVPFAAPTEVETPEEGAALPPCVAEEHKLLEEFDHHIGTGRQLIEDAITTIISRHTAADIATPDGKDVLKAEIRNAVERLIHEPKVTRVLFTNFITQ